MFIEPGACRGPALFGTIAESEQRLLAAERRSIAGYCQNFFWGEVGRLAVLEKFAGGLNEHAVVAAIPAEEGNRNEHLARIGDDAGAARAFKTIVPEPRRER